MEVPLFQHESTTRNLVDFLKKVELGNLPSVRVLVGFDGFVDTLLEAVATRVSATKYSPISTIGDFAERIYAAKGRGTNIELVTKCEKLGGNATILANTLATLGLRPILIAPVGEGDPLPIFTPLLDKCSSWYNLGAPGYTDALEFSDGKLMFGKHSAILTYDDKKIREKVCENALLEAFENLSCFAAVNWTMLLGQTKLWKYLQDDIFPRLESTPKMIFIDLADPVKRLKEDLQEALTVLLKFQDFSPVTLSLNELEAHRLFALYGISKAQDHSWLETEAKEAAQELQNMTQLSRIVIHTTRLAAAATAQESASIVGPYTESPTITTGGGDNFNGGFIFGKILQLDDTRALQLAATTSGYYVRHARSPSIKDLFSL